MWTPCVQVTHQLLEQVFQGSWASSSSSAERLQPTGPSLGVHLEQSGQIVQDRWAQRQEEGGQQRLQDSPPLGSLGWHCDGGALKQKTEPVASQWSEIAEESKKVNAVFLPCPGFGVIWGPTGVDSSSFTKTTKEGTSRYSIGTVTDMNTTHTDKYILVLLTKKKLKNSQYFSWNQDRISPKSS